MRTVTLKSGEKVPVLGLGTWRMGERESERAAEVEADQARPRARHPPDRHRRDVRRGQGRGDRRRGHGRPARRDLPRQQGLSPQRLAQGRHRCLRAQPRAPQDRPARPLPAALARLPPAGRDGGGVRDPQQGRQDPQLGRQQPRRRRHGRAGRRADGEQLRLQPGALSPGLARHRVAAPAPMPEGKDHGDGLLAAGPGAAAAQAGAEEDRRQARLRSGGRSRSPGCCASPASSRFPRPSTPSTCAPTSRRSTSSSTRTTWPPSTPPSRRPSAPPPST